MLGPLNRPLQHSWGPQKKFLQICGPIWGRILFWADYRHVECPERPNGTPCSYSTTSVIWHHPAEENGQNVNLGSFGCSHNSCAGELPRSASSHFNMNTKARRKTDSGKMEIEMECTWRFIKKKLATKVTQDLCLSWDVDWTFCC